MQAAFLLIDCWDIFLEDCYEDLRGIYYDEEGGMYECFKVYGFTMR